MNEYYVYAHVDKETNTPFYIGKGKQRRAYGSRKHPYYLEFTSDYLKTFEVKFIAKNISETLALDIEDSFIRKFGHLHNGTGCLINFWGGLSENTIDVTKKYKFIENEKIFEVENLIPFDFGNNRDYYISHLDEAGACWYEYNLHNFKYNKFNFSKSQEYYIQYLTEYGKYLFDIDINKFSAFKLISLFNKMTNKYYKKIRNKMLEEVKKQSVPRKPWEAPFSLLKNVDKNSVFSICVSNPVDLSEDITNVDLIKKISKVALPDIDYIIYDRIGKYFDLVIQKNVWIEVNGERITKPDMNCHFIRPNYKALMKIIKSKNKGLDLKAKYIGMRSSLPSRPYGYYHRDIADFEISV